MAETQIAKTTDQQPPPGEQAPGVFQRYFDSIQVACDPAPPLWPEMETPEVAELREEQGLPPPRPFQHKPYDHSRKEAAAAGPHRAAHRTEAAKREPEPHKASTITRR